MGLIEAGGLLFETAAVFEFLRGVYDAFPIAVKILISGTFGGVLYIAVLKHFRG